MIQIDRPTDEISQRALALFAAKAMRAIGMKGELSVRVTSNRQIQDLNRRFRRKDKPTDVLSFPAALDGTLGDIAISSDIAAANATQLGHSLGTELKVLILHGLLHLAGYDHESDNGEMTARESQLRQKLGLPLGLIERTETTSGAPLYRTRSLGSRSGRGLPERRAGGMAAKASKRGDRRA